MHNYWRLAWRQHLLTCSRSRRAGFWRLNYKSSTTETTKRHHQTQTLSTTGGGLLVRMTTIQTVDNLLSQSISILAAVAASRGSCNSHFALLKSCPPNCQRFSDATFGAADVTLFGRRNRVASQLLMTQRQQADPIDCSERDLIKCTSVSTVRQCWSENY